MSKGLEALEKVRKQLVNLCDYIRYKNPSAFIECNNDIENYVDTNYINSIKKELKALEILNEHIIIDEKNGYVEFLCDFSLPTNSKYENEEHFKEKIDLLKEVLDEKEST